MNKKGALQSETHRKSGSPIVATQLNIHSTREREREKTLFAKVFSRRIKKYIQLCRKYILPQWGDFVNS